LGKVIPMGCSTRTSRSIASLGLACAVLSASARAEAADADEDGVVDQADAFPCDANLAAVASSSAMIVFEDQWPTTADLDLNDVVVRTHWRVYKDALGRTRRISAFFDPAALGSDFDNGLALQLPVPGSVARAQRRIGDGPWELLVRERDSDLTLILAQNLRELFAGQPGPVNTVPDEPLAAGAMIELQLDFSGSGVQLDVGRAPFDLFIFRAGDFSHQVHLPQFSGTEAMRRELFNQGEDRSAFGRSFIHTSGIPFALDLRQTTLLAREGTALDLLYPDLLGFAASSGLLNGDFYITDVQAQYAIDVPWLAIPEGSPPDMRCTYTYGWATGPYGPCAGGFGSWVAGAWSPCSGAPNDCGTGTQSQSSSCQAVANSGFRTRAVWCARSDGRVVIDSRCAEDPLIGPRPATTAQCTPTTVNCQTPQPPTIVQTCVQESGCSAVWNCGPWSTCTNQCGGTQTCTPACQRFFDGAWVAATGCIGTPVTTRACGNEGSLGYSWVQNGDWGNCTNACGGTESQTVWCRDNCTNASADTSNCQPPGPSRTRTCGSSEGLGYEWRAGLWNACSDMCGGNQTRSVTCFRRCDNAPVADAFCPAASRPATTQACGSGGALSYTWVQQGDWSVCSNACGGTQTQTVWCRENCTLSSSDPANCQAPRPGSSRVCGGVDGLGFEWRTTSWTGCTDICGGSQTRGVACHRVCDGAVVADSSCSAVPRPTSTQACGSNDARGYTWQVGAWSTCTDGCGGQQARTVSCRRECDGATVADALCSGVKPATTQSCGSSSSLGFAWVQNGDWSACSDTCGGQQTQTVWCRNQCTGASVDPSSCSGTPPPATRTCGSVNARGNEWRTTSWGTCSDTCGGSQSRTVSCTRVCDGVLLADSACSAPRPASTQSCGSNEALGYSWRTTVWSACSDSCGGTQTRTVECRRDCDGVAVADSFCTAPKPAISQACGSSSALGFGWVENGDWSTCSNACGGTQTQTVTCRNLCTGASAAASSCTAPAPATTRACGSAGSLGSEWRTGSWGTCSNTCGGQQSRTVGCYRICDGVLLSDSSCSGARPAGTQSCGDSSGLGYTWQTTAWSACSDACGGRQTRTAFCRRECDGAVVADSFCGGTRPAVEQACGSSGALGFGWVANGDWSTCSNVCGGSQSQTVACRNLCTGAAVAASSCTGVAPASTRTCGDLGALGTEWRVSAWASCSNICGGQETRTVACHRSCDGAVLPDSACTAPKPASAQACGSNAALGYTWHTTAWSGCSNSCGGTETRSVVCRRECDGAVVADSFCGAGKPAASQACGSGTALGFGWVEHADWSTCSNVCGGTQSQTVSCRNLCTGATVSSSSCTTAPPASTRACGGVSGLGNEWRSTAWANCSNVCGGWEKRDVGCYRVCDGTLMADSACSGTRPIDCQACGNSGALGYRWWTSSWGSCSNVCAGTQTRTVVCRRECDGAVVDDSFCAGQGAKPSASQACGSPTALGNEWRTGNWLNNCSNSCGGVETRPVGCYEICSGVQQPDSACSGTRPDHWRACGSLDSLGFSWQYTYPSCPTCTEATSVPPSGLWCRRNCDSANFGTPTICGVHPQPGNLPCQASVSGCNRVQTTYWARAATNGSVPLSAIGPVETGRSGSGNSTDKYTSRCSVVGGSGTWNRSPWGNQRGECWVAGRKTGGGSLGFAEDDPSEDWGLIRLTNGTNPRYNCAHAGFGPEVIWTGNGTYPASDDPQCSGRPPDMTCYYIRYCKER
jgi:LruC domain-containing protein